MANVLKIEKKIAVLSMLTEGASIRSVERATGVNRETIGKLLVACGDHCERLLEQHLSSLKCRVVQLDELYSYILKKQRHVTPADPAWAGDCYCYIGLDHESRMIVHWEMGKRTEYTTDLFVGRLAERLQGQTTIYTDGWPAYVGAIARHFGSRAGYSQVIKHYDGDGREHRYSPGEITHVEERWIQGVPEGKPCTSHVERLNWSVRTYIRRFTRLSNGFSRKYRNLRAAFAIFACWYNFVKGHKTHKGATPAMVAGIVPSFWTLADLIP